MPKPAQVRDLLADTRDGPNAPRLLAVGALRAGRPPVQGDSSSFCLAIVKLQAAACSTVGLHQWVVHGRRQSKKRLFKS